MNYTWLTDAPELQNTTSVVTLGNFDGVHLGHQLIFETVMNAAVDKGAVPLAFSFYPHPREVLSQVRLALISTLDQRAAKIKELFAPIHYGTISFDHELSQCSARDFLTWLQETFRMSVLVIGSTTHIGKNREGSPERIVELSKEFGFDVIVVDPKKAHDMVISSSLIRSLIIKGEVQRVASYLGEPFVTEGQVIHGKSLGRRLGYPTANIRCFSSQLLPANGVYAVWAMANGKRYQGAVNLGYRPTLEEESIARHLEVHFIDEKLELYDKTVQIEWVSKVRDEIKFNSLKELENQISKDVINIQKILSKQ